MAVITVTVAIETFVWLRRFVNRQETQAAAATVTSYPHDDKLRSYLFRDEPWVDELYNQLFKPGTVPSSTQVQTGRQRSFMPRWLSFQRTKTRNETYEPEKSPGRQIRYVEQHLASQGRITHSDLANWRKVYALVDKLAARDPTFPLEPLIKYLNGYLEPGYGAGLQLDGRYVSITGQYRVDQVDPTHVLLTTCLPASPDSAKAITISIRCRRTHWNSEIIDFDAFEAGTTSIAATCIGQFHAAGKQPRQLDVSPIAIFK